MPTTYDSATVTYDSTTITYDDLAVTAATSGGAKVIPLPGVFWTIDGIATPLANWSSGTTAFGGFSQMRGVIKEADARRIPSSVAQGSVVIGHTGTGTVVFQGRLSAPPAIRGGLATIAAQGESVRAAKRATRLLYQVRGADLFTAGSNSPHNYNTTESMFGVEVRPGSILFRLDGGKLPTTGHFQEAVLWAPSPDNARFTRYAFQWIANAATAAIDIRGLTAIGPSGAGTLIGAHSLNATSGAVDQVIGAGLQFDQFVLEIKPNTNIGANADPGFAWVFYNIRMNGIAVGDSMTGSQVVTDVGGRLGYDTSAITSTGLNVLPLDWASGSWAELLSYIATLEDRYWRVMEDGRLEYDAWGTKEWTVYQADGATVDLTPLELYNQVTVKYVDVGGAPREVTVSASPDPLATSGIVNVWTETLADVQADSTLATAVANNLLPRVSSLRESGRIDCVRAYDSTGRDAPYEIRAGDTVRVADRDMNTATTHRIFEVEYTPAGVSLGIEGAVSIASLLGRSRLAAARAPSTAELPELEIAAVEAGPGPPEPYALRQDWYAQWASPDRGLPDKRTPGGGKKKGKVRRKYF